MNEFAPAGWYQDPTPGIPHGQHRYFDGSNWTSSTRSDAVPTSGASSPPNGAGLGAGSGLLAGLIGGALGGLLLLAISRSDAIAEWDENVRYMATLGSYAAVLGALLLATHAASCNPETAAGWFLGGALLGGGAGGLGSLGLIKAIVVPVVERSSRQTTLDDIKNIYTLAFALIFSAIGLSIGIGLGLVRGGRGALGAGLAGGIVGAIGGAIFVQVVLYSDTVRTESELNAITVVMLAIIGGAIGLALGATHPREPVVDAVTPSGVAHLPAPPAATMYPSTAPLTEDAPPWPQASFPRAATRPSPAPHPSGESALAQPAPTAVTEALKESNSEVPPSGDTSTISADAVRALIRQRSVYTLEFSSGQRVTVSETGVIAGREPRAGAHDRPDIVVVAVPDPDRNTSRSHISFDVVDGRLYATDRESTNGSAVETPNGRRFPLVGLQPTIVEAGATVLFGSHRVRIERG